MRRLISAISASGGAALLLLGCGRPATQQDCDEIVGRIAELELREAKTTDPADVAAQVAQTQQEFRSKAKHECVGKRITPHALACVRGAKTATEIVHECLN